MVQEENNKNVLGSVGTNHEQLANTPNVAMSESYNSAAVRPVFSPETQAKATAMFGTNDQRQIATNGIKKNDFI